MRFDGRAVSQHELDRMAEALRPYGPDRSHSLLVGSVGFVNVLMRMTPEDRFDCPPLRGSSGAIVTADIRLDNRDEIVDRLGIAPSEAFNWPDSRLLLAAWERLGDATWPLLRGPFVAAIWDPHRRALTIARDHLGLNVAMWHQTQKRLAFSTMPRGLFALPDVPRQLNEEKLADFLVLNHAELATTTYKDIFRLLPAHVTRVSCDGLITQTRYWSLREVKPVRKKSDQDYADGLRESLDRAVRRHLRSAHPVGCLLSGGLDSSSVAILAARALREKNQRLATYTQVPREGFDFFIGPGRYADETPYVEAIVRAAGNIDPTFIRSDECDDLADLERFFVAFEAPVRNPTNLGWILTILRRAKAEGRRVLLTGECGNYSISWSGWTQAVDHLVEGRIFSAFRQWRQYYRRYPVSAWRAFRILFAEPLLPDWVGLLRYRWRHRGHVSPWQSFSAIRPEFAASMGVEARARALGHDFLYRVRPGERIRSLNNLDYAGDWHCAEKAISGVELRDPTADIDVISYCFGVPTAQYLVEEIDRSLVRRAMWGQTPPAVLTNTRRGLQSADWFERWGRCREQLAANIADMSQSPLARRAIDLDRLSDALRNWPTGGWHERSVTLEYERAFTRAVAAGRFLRWFETANA